MSEGEIFFLDIMDNLVEYKIDSSPDIIYYKLNGEIVIEKDMTFKMIYFSDKIIKKGKI